VRVFAPLACRVARISRREGCDAATAAAIAHRLDDARRAYVRRHYHTDLRDPLLYDVQINTGSMALDEAVDAIAAIVNARAGAAVAN
jgi:cytidylate kinase